MTKSTKMIAVIIIALALLAITCSTVMEAVSSDTSVENESPELISETSDLTEEPEVKPASSNAVTYFVRSDGGSSEQCTGTVDAPYSGSGTNQPCAWDHPFRALPPEQTARIAGGDTLIIAAGSYKMGLDATGADVCDADYPWDCYMSAIPSGGSGAPTRILGAGWDSGCANPPELWGTQRAYYIINLDGASNVEVACLEITDHETCAEDHTGGLACERENFPYGDWAETGLFAADSANVYLHDLDIHGLATNGVLAGRLTDWSVENVRLVANGLAGWNGDLEDDDANSGTLSFKRWTVAWNGCVENYGTNEPQGCWAQDAGGYGDGVGTGETGGTWIIEDSEFLHNTSDGLDLFYTRLSDSNVIIRRTISAGNAGDQIKATGPTHIENVVAVSNCGFFDAKPFTYNVDYCRSGGSAIALYPKPGDQLTVINSTITGHGDCLIIAECGQEGGCNGSETILLRNSILLGNPEFRGGGDTTCLAWSGLSHDPFIFDYDIMSNLKAMPSSCPVNSMCNIDPGLVNDNIDAFDAHLAPGSPAIDAGTTNAAPPDDFSRRSRDAQPDIGAHEYWEPTSWIYLPFSKSS